MNDTEIKKEVIETPTEKKKKIEKILKERIVQYKDLANAFHESIDTYDSLIKVVTENKNQFKKYADLILQFTTTKRSFTIQRKNTLKAVKRFEKALKNIDEYTPEQVLELLKV